MKEKASQRYTQNVKAGALMCPTCCVEYVEVKGDFEIGGIILRDIVFLKCPICQEEIFTPEQQKIIQDSNNNIT